MKNFLTCMLCVAVFFSLTAPVQSQPSRLKEDDRDSFGIWQKSPNYRQVESLGIRVVDVPEFKTFFAYYLPPGFESQSAKRAIVAVHGTGGTVYAEIKDEAEMANKLGYAVIAVQMSLPLENGRNLPPRQLYGLIHQAVEYMRQEKQLDLHRLAYVGFSVGGSKAFQIAWFDRMSPEPLFSLIVNHSGLSKAEKEFLSQIDSGRGPAQPFRGLPFALYCGEKDGEWQGQQCDDMTYWEKEIAALGAGPVRTIRDEQGGHMDYRQKPAHHENFMKWFIELTP